ncbi:hypothetical protein ACJMK2_036078 [Sinanodonta woodiana]|uniref:BPTI/Kunitz inhibitor domain-containing protein n=1 Tax=Sinanodonta woodiana TaxID=1069815 RepID=A0ABD3WG28_SINWO
MKIILIVSLCCWLVVAQDNVCERPAHSGMCMAYFPRFYYDSTSRTCKEFIYGGCQSNGNNFETFELCMEMCAPNIP